jgi:hypothetical protein
MNLMAAVTWTVGSYVGTGSTQSITGLAFQPDVVIIKSNSTTPAQIKISTMAATASRAFTSLTTPVTNAITSLNANGFTVGTNSNVNTNGVTYYFYAFQAGNSIKVGTYNGDGTNTRVVASGVAKMEFNVIIPGNTYGGSVIYTDLTGDGYIYDDKSGGSYSSSRSFGYPHTWPATGFQVTGNGLPNATSQPNTNRSGITYYYFSFVETAGESFIGNYYGNGGASKSITGLGFKPNFVITTGGSYNVVMRSGKISGNSSQRLNDVANSSDLITAFTTNGFDVGGSDDVNLSSTIYKQVFVAFGGPTGGVLPIELLHFDAQRESDKKVIINWSTASEDNNNHFTIERSEDGKNFEAIGSVMGSENSTSKINYQFIDENSPANALTIYYRLSQTDNDGVSKTFNMVAVSSIPANHEFNMSIAQNPVSDDELIYDLNLSNDATMNLQIIDNTGSIAFSSNYYYSRGNNRYSLNTNNLKKGSYILNMTDLTGSSKQSLRFIVDK